MQAKTDWDAHIDAWKKSDLSKAEYCRRNGIKIPGFYRMTSPQRSDANTELVKIPFRGFPAGFASVPEPTFEFHLEIPFHFRLRLNLQIGRWRT